MSDAHAPEAAAASHELFEKHELQEFVTDDQEAGRAICKLLSVLFIYTLIAMSIAAGWTYFAILQDNAG